jgi:hypothetical protein
MKRLYYLLATASLLLCASSPSSANIVGYVNYPFVPGDNLFENPLVNGADDLNTIFNPLVTPQGTTISLWNPTTLSYSTSSTFSGGSWTADLTLNPGTGARLTAYAPFTNTFTGYVTDRVGNTNNPDLGAGPPVFSGPNGVYLLGDKLPVAATGTAVFTNVIGRLPNNGEQIIRLNAVTQTYTISTYNSILSSWDNQSVTKVGDSLFFNIGGVAFTPPPLTVIPEPSATGLALLNFAVCIFLRRRKT